jgi:hypothetical protein
MQALKRVFHLEYLLASSIDVSCPPLRKATLHAGVEEGVPPGVHLFSPPLV